MSLYLDHNATARVRPQAIAAMTRTMENVGNPSSIHAAGRTARAVMEQARADVGALIAKSPQHLQGHASRVDKWVARRRPAPTATRMRNRRMQQRNLSVVRCGRADRQEPTAPTGKCFTCGQVGCKASTCPN